VEYASNEPEVGDSIQKAKDDVQTAKEVRESELQAKGQQRYVAEVDNDLQKGPRKGVNKALAVAKQNKENRERDGEEDGACYDETGENRINIAV